MLLIKIITKHGEFLNSVEPLGISLHRLERKVVTAMKFASVSILQCNQTCNQDIDATYIEASIYTSCCKGEYVLFWVFPGHNH